MRRAKTIVLWTLGALLLSTLAAVIFLASANDDFYRWAMQQAIEGKIDALTGQEPAHPRRRSANPAAKCQSREPNGQQCSR